MWRNYWTVAIRTLAKSRTYSIINIAGLAIGMAACIMILLYVRYEESYDSWIPNVANVYELQTWIPHPQNGQPTFFQMGPYIAKDVIKKDYPEVEAVAYAMSSPLNFLKDGQVSAAKNYLYVDNDFLKVVELPLVAGTTLSAPQTAVLTREEAIKRYGTDQVVGRTLTTMTQGKEKDYRIVGVLKNVPKNSSFKINALLQIDFEAMYAQSPQFMSCWSCSTGWVYLELRPGSDVKAMQAREPAWERRNIPTDGGYNAGDEEDWHFVNLRDVHLGKAQVGSMTPGNDRKAIATFAVIAILILGMAIVNFTNLATARASQRAREVALRKVLGAKRRQLIVQFLAESLLISAVAMLLALAVVELLLKPFSNFLDADLRLSYLGPGGMLLPAIGITLAVGILSGLYPAAVLSHFQPAKTLKANRSAADSPGSGWLRMALVVAQSAISIGLIVCTAVIYGQSVFARSVDPGYKRDHILQVDHMNSAALFNAGQMVRDRMTRIPGVVATGLTNIGINTDLITGNALVLPPGRDKSIGLVPYLVDEGFFNAMGLKLLAGRWFDPNRPIDDATVPYPVDLNAERAIAQRGVNIVINESAVKKLGFKSPQDAIGEVVKSPLFSEGTGIVNVTIIGVVADSRFRSIRTPIEPVMFTNSKHGEPWMVIRYRGDPATVEAAVERQWKQIAPQVPFEAKFSDDIIRDEYKSEQSRADIFGAFSLLAVVIGCLGLFGLAAFTAERRTKEIGIRKVFGARTRDIVQLLVWQFSRPVIIANIIAWPVAWWFMRDWLNTFDQRIALTPVPFVLAGAIALGIAIATVVGHAVKVARANPIHALRYE